MDKNQVAKQKIREQVAQEFAADGVRPDEVVLKDNGDIVIDRRKTKSWATPVIVGKWS
ncbi:hypothetical protein GCM10010466_37750 [Planomonospora alba]|uniref:Uncharacterized protein n=1 Tax=Planomonospora alba TaxID=161354 RepID=A0ABP6NC97_9ACTN